LLHKQPKPAIRDTEDIIMAPRTNQVNKTSNKAANLYHHPTKLLKAYHNVRWSLKLSMEQHQEDFEGEYGMTITQYLEDIYAAGIEFSGTKLEHHANCMKRTAEMIKLIDRSVHLIKEYNSDGESYYWIIYHTYLSPQKLRGVDGIVEKLQPHIPYLTRDNYFKLRKKAVTLFSSVLWGYTTKDEIDALNVFICDSYDPCGSCGSYDPRSVDMTPRNPCSLLDESS